MFRVRSHYTKSFFTNLFIEFAALACILMLATCVRFHNLTDNPGWYTDEATHINIAQNLLEGRTQYLAINESTLLFGRLPLFEYTLAATMRLSSPDITTLRSLTALLGVISVGLLYASLRITQSDRLVPLLAALVFAIYPSAVIYSRIGFSYALLTPLVIIVCTSLITYIDGGKRRNLAFAACTMGIGLTSDLMIGSLVPLLILTAIVRRPTDLIWCLPLVVIPFAIYTTTMLKITPDAFTFDLRYTFSRLSAIPLRAQPTYIANNYLSLIRQEILLLPAVAGLFLIKSVSIRWIWLLALTVPIVVLGRTVALHSLSFYYMIPLLPVIAVGLASLVRVAIDSVLNFSLSDQESRKWRLSDYASRGVSLLAGCILLMVPLMDTTATTLRGTRLGFVTPIEPFLVNGEEARKVAEYINPRAQASDMVIAPPTIAWLLHSNVSDIQVSIAAAGQETPHLPANIPPERYAFDPSYENARYVVIDPIWRNWGTVHLPGADDILSEIETGWEPVFATDTLEVYANPQLR